MSECCNCCQCCKKCKCPFLKLFLLQLFDIGDSAGSLFNEAFVLFRTFQRFSAPRSFSAKFSDECLKMFSWAKDFINFLFSSLLPTDPFTEFELFYIYNFAAPLMILTFISALISSYKFMSYIFIYGLFLTLGIGIGYIGINNTISISLIIPTSVIILISFIFRKKNFFSCFQIFNYIFFNNNSNSDTICCNCRSRTQFTLSLMPSFIIFQAVTTPINNQRTYLAYAEFFYSFILCFISLIIELILKIRFREKQDFYFKKATGKIISFAIKCFSLLIIPSTEHFVNIMQENYKNYWNCIVGYIVLGFLLPIAITFLMIKNNFPEICDKYIKREYSYFNFYYIELIDICKQISYAILAAYNINVGCILLETVWLALIIVCYPFKNKSDFSLTIGNSLAMFLSNGAVLYGDKKGFEVFGFGTTVAFMFLICLPAIISIYIYFFKDFETQINERTTEYDLINDNSLNNYEIEKKYGFNKRAVDGLANAIKIILPFVWLFYGLNVSLINKRIKL